MEYTKDIILNVNYGQARKKRRFKWNVLDKIVNTMQSHKIMTTIISITLILILLDFMLITSFIKILSRI